MWEVSWRLNNILTPSSFVFSSTSFSFCWAAQSGVLRSHSPLLGADSLYCILSPTNWLQLTELPVTPGYIMDWRPPASCECRICTQFNLSTVKVIPWYLRPDAPVPWLTAGSKVNMLQINNLQVILRQLSLMKHISKKDCCTIYINVYFFFMSFEWMWYCDVCYKIQIMDQFSGKWNNVVDIGHKRKLGS